MGSQARHRWRRSGLVRRATRAVADARLLVRRRLGRTRGPFVVAHAGFGNEHGLLVFGRVVEAGGGAVTAGERRQLDRAVAVLQTSWRLARTVAIPRATVRWRHGGAEGSVRADDDGFFEAHLPWARPADELEPWEHVELGLAHDGAAPGTVARVRVAPSAGPLAVIVDLDCTLLPVTPRGVVAEILADPDTPRAAPGLPSLLRGLAAAGGAVFYVSGAPADVGDLLRARIEAEELPDGPILLRTGAWNDRWLAPRRSDGKLAYLRRLLDAFPHTRFVMVGNANSRDPAVYAVVAGSRPHQVACLYLYRVTRHLPRVVDRMRRLLGARGVEAVVADGALPFARHAQERGWLGEATVEAVASEVARETNPRLKRDRAPHPERARPVQESA